MTTPPPTDRVGTGIQGLDDILGGGLPPHRIYLVAGDSGTGKTTLGLQFLLHGIRNGEVGLYVTLSETSEEIHAVGASHDWSLDGLAIHELTSVDEASGLPAAQTLFHPSEIELNETTRGVREVVDDIRPQRIVFDSLSGMRVLARDPLRYRRQILSLKQFFNGRRCTVLLLDDQGSDQGELQIESLAHGVVETEQLSPDYGPERRRLRVKKLRGVKFHGGYHDFRIKTGGIHVYPRLTASEHHREFVIAPLSTGMPALDTLLGGGVDRGTSTLIVGAAGTGKTTVGLQLALAAAARGERATMYLFEENAQTVQARAAGLGMPLAQRVRERLVLLRQVDPAEMTAGELAHDVRTRVVEDDVRVVVLDTMNGYMNAMPDERFLTLHVHEMVTFLNHMGVATVLIEGQRGPVVHPVVDSLELSFLVDNVVLLSHFESQGAVHQAISVLKKHTGAHERTIHEMRFDGAGIHIGAPLAELNGVLSGTPSPLSPKRP